MSASAPLSAVNRELSWLSFNARVLQEAEDDSVPLVDRLRFMAIYSSNLDEFFRVRVAALRGLARLGKKSRRRMSPPPAHVLSAIHATVIEQQERLGRLYHDQLVPALRRRGVVILGPDDVTPEQRRHLLTWFDARVRPHLEPIRIDTAGDGPFLENGGLHLVVAASARIEVSGTTIDDSLGLVNVPSRVCGRFVGLEASDGLHPVMYLDDVIRLFLGEVFPSFARPEAYSIKMTRDAELDLDDEFAEDVTAMIRKGLSRRDAGPPTRLLYDQRMPYRIMRTLEQVFRLDERDLVAGGRYHNLSDFARFPTVGLEDDFAPPLARIPRDDLDAAALLFDAIDASDRLLSFPYEPFDHVERFFREAADDDAVTKIWATLYRVAADSSIVGTLIRAAESGKKVTAVVEALARFDEQNNLDWADRMASAGVNVVYGAPGRKVHAKLALVERIVDNRKRLYAWLGTGNFNESTARVYADHGLLTADEEMTRDVRRLFLMLQGYLSEPRFKHLLVAPTTLRSRLYRLIDRERRNAERGLPSGIVVKVNNLEDPGIIRRLERAAGAGVPVRLVVRGVFCMDPSGTGLMATSIVDRFLEHARIFVFANAGVPDVYLASADWMERSFERRVEVTFPIRDPLLAHRLLELLDLQLRDSVKARLLDGTGSNRRVAGTGGTPVRCQVDAVALLSRQPAVESPFEALFSRTVPEERGLSASGR